MEKEVLTQIKGAFLYTFDRHKDERGYFQEVFNASRLETADLGIVQQINLSSSTTDVIRGMHVAPYSKLVTCVHGRIFDVIIDVRENSPTKGNWYGAWLSEHNCRQLLIPAGCGHGFFAESEITTIVYAQNGVYDPSREYAITWKDSEFAIDWPKRSRYILSDKDKSAPTWEELRNAANQTVGRDSLSDL